MPESSSPRVVDFSTHLSGPLASHFLAELGADVIKVEHRTKGDGNRGVEPFIHGVGMIHVNCGPGTRSIGADPRAPYWEELVAACVRWADVAIVGARPVDAARRGLDFPALTKHNDQLVYCSVSGYGSQGPWSAQPAHGLQMEALAGAVPVEWNEGRPRVPRGFRTAGTTAASIFAAMGIWAALYRREREGGPFFVETSCWGAAVSWQWRDVTSFANLGHGWTEYSEVGTRYAMYATSDQRAILLCPLEQRFWEALCDLLDLPQLRASGDWEANGMDWGMGPAYERERELLIERIGQRTLAELSEALTDLKGPFAPMLTLDEVIGSEHAAANNVLGATSVAGEDASFTRAAVRLGRSEAEATDVLTLPPPPMIGADSAEILETIGAPHLRDQIFT